jgi:serine/threonine protein kinase
MALGPGTRLGPDEIVSALGAGGMGEVYRARDAHLQRDVAIKVLPPSVASDPERLTAVDRIRIKSRKRRLQSDRRRCWGGVSQFVE